MGIKKNIEDLFEGEEAPSPESSNELARIFEGYDENDAPDLAELKKSGVDEEQVHERREFTRVPVADRQIHVQFDCERQFAKQYLENISLGGVFVRTEEKYPMGALVPVSFKVPEPSGMGELRFDFVGKVCRVTDSGVGLEFTNLTSESRSELERYVKSVLPKGRDLRHNPKKASIDRILKLREERERRKKERQKYVIQVGFIIALLALNGLFLKGAIETESEATRWQVQQVQLDGQKRDVEEIRSVESSAPGEVEFVLEDGSRVSVDPDQVMDQLPYHLRESVKLVDRIPPVKPKRRSKNSGNLVRIRR